MSTPSFARPPAVFKRADSFRSSVFLVLPVFAVLAVANTTLLIVFLCGLTVTVIILLLLQDREPPILLPPLFQWSEVALVRDQGGIPIFCQSWHRGTGGACAIE